MKLSLQSWPALEEVNSVWARSLPMPTGLLKHAGTRMSCAGLQYVTELSMAALLELILDVAVFCMLHLHA